MNPRLFFGCRLTSIILLLLFALGGTTLMLATNTAMAQPAKVEKRKVIICQDTLGPGGTNLQSILMLLQSPDVEVLGIAVGSGDGWRDESVAHVLRLLEIAGRTDVPVVGGAVHPLLNSERRTAVWEQLYGKLIYKGAWTAPQAEDDKAIVGRRYHADPYLIPESPAGAPRIKALPGDAASFLVRKVREFPGQVTIWSGGPLTDVALASRLEPRFASLAKELVFMGGSFSPVPADNAFAEEYLHATRLEFNMRWDPEAASLVLHEAWPKVIQIPIDPTTRTMFRQALFDRIGAGDTPFASYVLKYGKPFPMWDELAAAVWLDPSLITRSATMLVDIDTAFTAGYGNTLSWVVGKGPNQGERPVLVVQDIDVPRFEEMTVGLLSRRARPR